eukprot:13284907-Alexandrium_andersonii.AAC.1
MSNGHRKELVPLGMVARNSEALASGQGGLVGVDSAAGLPGPAGTSGDHLAGLVDLSKGPKCIATHA